MNSNNLENKMFNVGGGIENVFIALMNIVSIVFLVVIPVMFSMIGEDKYRTKQVVTGLIGLFIYCFLLYVANPSLTFWAVK
jgi:hypothetical protein